MSSPTEAYLSAVPKCGRSKHGRMQKHAKTAKKKSANVGQRLRGGQNVTRVNLGGGNVLESVLSKTTFGGLRNWGWSGRRLFLLREMTESRQKKGGKTYRRWGVQKRFWGGVFRRIYGMFPPPPPEFSTPLGRSLKMQKSTKERKREQRRGKRALPCKKCKPPCRFEATGPLLH